MPLHVSSTCLVHETATYMCDDTRGCVMQFWPPDDEHMCSKHVEAWNKLTLKQNFCASSWLITEINNSYIFFHEHTVHLDIIKDFFIHQLMHKCIVLKTILKFTLKLTLKQHRHVSVQSRHHQGAHYALPDDGVPAPKHVGAVLMSILM